MATVTYSAKIGDTTYTGHPNAAGTFTITTNSSANDIGLYRSDSGVLSTTGVWGGSAPTFPGSGSGNLPQYPGLASSGTAVPGTPYMPNPFTSNPFLPEPNVQEVVVGPVILDASAMLEALGEYVQFLEEILEELDPFDVDTYKVVEETAWALKLAQETLEKLGQTQV